MLFEGKISWLQQVSKMPHGILYSLIMQSVIHLCVGQEPTKTIPFAHEFSTQGM